MQPATGLSLVFLCFLSVSFVDAIYISLLVVVNVCIQITSFLLLLLIR